MADVSVSEQTPKVEERKEENVVANTETNGDTAEQKEELTAKKSKHKRKKSKAQKAAAAAATAAAEADAESAPLSEVKEEDKKDKTTPAEADPLPQAEPETKEQQMPEVVETPAKTVADISAGDIDAQQKDMEAVKDIVQEAPAEVTKPEITKPEKSQEPVVEQPKVDEPAPTTEAPATDAPKSEEPATDAPTAVSGNIVQAVSSPFFYVGCELKWSKWVASTTFHFDVDKQVNLVRELGGANTLYRTVAFQWS